MKNILVVEDDLHTAEVITKVLQQTADFQVTCCNSAEDAEQYLMLYDYDLLILDCGLPRKSGIELCRDYMRSGSRKASVLFLTGRNTIDDKEIGFGVGADDYLDKPFDSRELLLRVQAILRRAKTVNSTILEFKDISIDSGRRRVMLNRTQEIRLSQREYSVLEYLMKEPGTHITSRELLSNVWQADEGASDESVRVLVHRLRSRLVKLGVQLSIENSHGYGYRVV